MTDERLGHLTLFLARRYDGLIDLNGVLLPHLRANQTVFDITVGGIEAYVQGLALPGRIVSIYYPDGEWLSHIVDAAYFQAWLQHADFHMVK